MNKQTIQSAMFCCIAFLLIVLGASFYTKDRMNRDDFAGAVSKEQPVDKEKVIYLTFDDGPSKNTSAILDILDKYKVKATFFVTGIQPDYLNLIKDEQKRGHAIGIHTFTHDYAKIYASKEAYFEDIKKTDDLILQQTGLSTNILRFPGGASNTVSRKYNNGIMTTLASEVTQLGYQYYDWNASNGDGNAYSSSSALISQALREVKGKDKVMMLMHDGGGNHATVKALPKILEVLIKQGYTFKVIDDTTPVFHHTIAN